jgi:hypothetical protein
LYVKDVLVKARSHGGALRKAARVKEIEVGAKRSGDSILSTWMLLGQMEVE